MQIHIELTDTFGGEANYSWVRWENCIIRDSATRREIMIRAKSEMGLTGVRGDTTDYGDMIEFRPRGMCQVMFISFSYSQFSSDESAS